ncbi:hypothetical protein RND71_013549 [Anisodus tanguticus]|uniref:alpha-1,2-Mannosidase n=1 Tax=Anisodus tanguticus TaxID=243964 RepID=A0AAE1S7C5_9SOLA|nr:hypothetical protein RND71_013549 [Anisodus tanguticus]
MNFSRSGGDVVKKMDISDDPIDAQKREQVKDAMRHGWSSYEKYAWGHKELQFLPRPNGYWSLLFIEEISKLNEEVMRLQDLMNFSRSGGDVGKKMDIADDPVDSQRRAKVKDAMRHAWSSYEKYAWGHDEFQPQTKNGVDSFGGLGATLIDSLDTLYIMGLDERFQRAREVVGGLLSAYDLSGDKLFLDKAQDIADRLLPAWNTPTGIPYNIINLSHGNPHNHRWTAAENVILEISRTFPDDGLLPVHIDPAGEPVVYSTITFGAMGDR